MDAFDKGMLVLLMVVGGAICIAAGSTAGRAAATRDMQRQAIQYNHAHYDHDTGEFKWNNDTEKVP